MILDEIPHEFRDHKYSDYIYTVSYELPDVGEENFSAVYMVYFFADFTEQNFQKKIIINKRNNKVFHVDNIEKWVEENDLIPYEPLDTSYYPRDINKRRIETIKWFRTGEDANLMPSEITYSPDGDIVEEKYNKSGSYGTNLHRKNGPAFIRYNKGVKVHERWYQNSRIDRPDGPADITYNNNGIKIEEKWYQNNELNRQNGPAHIKYDDNGDKVMEIWYQNDIKNRIDGPAVTYYDVNGNITYKEWYIQDKRLTKDHIKLLTVADMWSRNDIDNFFQYLPPEMLNITKQLYNYQEGEEYYDDEYYDDEYYEGEGDEYYEGEGGEHQEGEGEEYYEGEGEEYDENDDNQYEDEYANDSEDDHRWF